MNQFPSDKFVIIGVNCDSNPWIPQKLASDGIVTWRSFQSSSIKPNVVKTWGIQQVGITILIDQHGIINDLNVPYDELEATIEKLLQRPQSSTD